MPRPATLLLLALAPFTLAAGNSKVQVAVEWSYVDASRQETDEGLNLCMSLVSMASIRAMPQAGRFNDRFCLSNPQDAARLLGLAGTPQPGCRATAKGTAYMWLDSIEVLPEDEMYEERLVARLVSIEEHTITGPLASACD